jgi:hypothetical protein
LELLRVAAGHRSVQFGEQGCHVLVDVVSDVVELVERLVGWIAELPVDAALARDGGALAAYCPW